MHPNAALIERFYASFAARDAAGMKACYHPDVVFTDPAFGELNGTQVGAMWEMLVERGTDLRVTVSGIHADDEYGRAHWDAAYTFSQTRRPVVNHVDAEFLFRDGLIARHTDRFDFWTWARQALGPMGLALGWTPFLRKKVRDTARAGLARYMRAHEDTASS